MPEPAAPESAVPIGPFTIDAIGLLRPASADRFPAFHVTWRNRVVHTRMVQAPGAASTGSLQFSSRLGRVPSTAGPGSSRRGGMLDVLRGLPSLAPTGWELALSAEHNVVVVTTTPVTLPISAVALVTKVTQFLLTLAPYLDVLDAEGVSFACAGTVNTSPG